jgi:hypothetical protein
MLAWIPSDDSPPVSPDFDEVLVAEREYSQWQARNDAWFAQMK